MDEWFDARGKNPVDGPIYVKLKKVVVEWYIKFEDDGDYFFYFNVICSYNKYIKCTK